MSPIFQMVLPANFPRIRPVVFLLAVLSLMVILPHTGQAETGAIKDQSNQAQKAIRTTNDSVLRPQEGPDTPDWRHRKCVLYREYRDDALDALGTNAIGKDFGAAEQSFLQSDCVARVKVCPQSQTEVKYANYIALQMMNSGATGSFLPFACEKDLTGD